MLCTMFLICLDCQRVNKTWGLLHFKMIRDNAYLSMNIYFEFWLIYGYCYFVHFKLFRMFSHPFSLFVYLHREWNFKRKLMSMGHSMEHSMLLPFAKCKKWSLKIDSQASWRSFAPAAVFFFPLNATTFII